MSPIELEPTIDSVNSQNMYQSQSGIAPIFEDQHNNSKTNSHISSTEKNHPQDTQYNVQELSNNQIPEHSATFQNLPIQSNHEFGSGSPEKRNLLSIGPSDVTSYDDHPRDSSISQMFDEQAGELLRSDRAPKTTESQKATLAFNPKEEELITRPFGETILPEFQNDHQNIHGHGAPGFDTRKQDSAVYPTDYESDINPLLKYNLLHQSPVNRQENNELLASQPSISHSSPNTDSIVNSLEIPSNINPFKNNINREDTIGLPSDFLHSNERSFNCMVNKPDALNADLLSNNVTPVTEPNPANVELATESIEDVLLPGSQQALENTTPVHIISPNDHDQNWHITQPSESILPISHVDVFKKLPTSSTEAEGETSISRELVPESTAGLTEKDLKPNKQRATNFSSQFRSEISPNKRSTPSHNHPQNAPLFPEEKAHPIPVDNTTSVSDKDLPPIKEPNPENIELTTNSIENTLLPQTQHNISTDLGITEKHTPGTSLDSTLRLVDEKEPFAAHLKTQDIILPIQTMPTEQIIQSLAFEKNIQDNSRNEQNTSTREVSKASTLSTMKSVDDFNISEDLQIKKLKSEEEIHNLIPPVVNPLLNSNDPELTMNPIITFAIPPNNFIEPNLNTPEIEKETDPISDRDISVSEELKTPQLLLTPKQDLYSNPLDQVDSERDPLIQCNEEVSLPLTQREFNHIPEQHQFVPGAYPEQGTLQTYESTVENSPQPDQVVVIHQPEIIMDAHGSSKYVEEPPVIVCNTDLGIPDESQYLPGAFPDHDQRYNPYEDTLEEMMADVRHSIVDNTKPEQKANTKNEPGGTVSEFAKTFTVGQTEKKKLKSQENNSYVPTTNQMDTENLINMAANPNDDNLPHHTGLSDESDGTLSESSGPNTNYNSHGDHEIQNPEDISSFIAIGDIVSGKIQSGLGTITRNSKLKQRGRILKDEGKQILEAKRRSSVSS
ncbi:hypothetical protein K7432_007447 [Basidiobolus ranarum]|uniref:Uncharacterized protein n=1 Tax=Basidiobolus ranarum TaxID=34480 RepID=A0ABR2WTE4_9FUNG